MNIFYFTKEIFKFILMVSNKKLMICKEIMNNIVIITATIHSDFNAS